MPLANEELNIGRQKILQIFNYLKALNEHRNPVKRQIQEQPWVLWFNDLPDHPTISISKYSETNSDESSLEEGYVLRIRRPELTSPPGPPELIAQWLETGWENPEQQVRVKEIINEVKDNGEILEVRFDDEPKRQQVLDNWQNKRDEWARVEVPARRAMQVFERFYELYGQLQKESERYELVLGDGILSWKHPDESINHPVLLQRLQLEFNPDVPEFIIVESDYDVELYSGLFQSMTDVDGQIIASCRKELMENSYHPLNGKDTSEFLQRLVVQLSPRGEFIGEGNPTKGLADPQIGRSPVIFQRSRSLGFATAIEGVLDSLRDRKDLPRTLLNVAGVGNNSNKEQYPGETIEVEPEDILLGKSANKEQTDIAKKLRKNPGVLVQGPPGTGKTHTIANLLGHLLAQGKSVLVTSHTTKALRVLREKVAEELQSLCVSVLDSDSASRKQLENSVDTIVQWMSSPDGQQLEGKVKELSTLRRKLVGKLEDAREGLKQACEGEYRDIVVAGENYDPSDAARKVASGYEKDDWIPSPVTLGEPLPISTKEVVELYRTNACVRPEDEMELGGKLPDPNDLIIPEEFSRLAREYEDLSRKDLAYRADLWGQEAAEEDPKNIESLGGQLQKAVEFISGEEWKLAAIAAGYNGDVSCEPWQQLIKMIEEVRQEAARTQGVIYQYQPNVSGEGSLEDQVKVVDEITTHLKSGGKISGVKLLINRKWKNFIQNSSVGGNRPTLVEHFEALKVFLRLQMLRTELSARWDAQVGSLGAPAAKEFQQSPEDAAIQFCPAIRGCLDWYVSTWRPLEERLKSLGFRWDSFLNEQPPNLNSYGELLRLKESVQGSLYDILQYRSKYIRFKQIKSRFKRLNNVLGINSENGNSTQVTNTLAGAVRNRDAAVYKEAFERLVDLHNRHTDLTLRKELLERLGETAPAWAAAVRERRGLHGEGEVPGDAGSAWVWRQLHDELEKRGETSLSSLQQKIEQLSTELSRITNELIKYKAWGAQLRRTTLSQQQALEGYLNIMRKIGAGTGRMVPKYRAEARRKTSECRGAVPVWIMPLTRVAENFDPRNARFDVAIIDEASQCDVMGLLAFYLAKQVIIVGDHEQVSPVAVGQKMDVVQHLIDEHLQGIPNSILYDGQRSVYDIAKESFGDRIRLVEHFRCVPEIIQFSNKLSYNGAIQPLRDHSGISVKPHVISYRVEGAFAVNKVNEKEAQTVASLLVAATEQPEYKDKTFGVVALLGNEGGQAMEIDRLLRRHLPEDEYTKRRIVCGNSAHFQGDERDVMFLSVVDSPKEKSPLKMLGPGNQDMMKKRYNVAASRAGDQMWVVHSLDPRTDLKPGDLRRLLIEHAEDPQATIRELEKAEERTESVFEREVMQRLIAAGYKVIPQWKVGYYRIDLVVEGNGQRLAVECDGDRYHPIEKLPEDMGRQAILERLGWTFVRIRGSQFFRNPDKAMEPVFERINQLGITPESPDSGIEHENDNVEQELKERVIRRAAELRRQWLGEEESAVAHSQEEEGKHSGNDVGQSRQTTNGKRVNNKRTELDIYQNSKQSSKINFGLNMDEQRSNSNGNGLIAHASKPIREVFDAMEFYIMSLGSNIKKKELQRHYAFKTRKNFACIVVNSKKLTVYLRVDPSRVELQRGFAKDVSEINHPGTGDLELTIKSLKDLEKAKTLIYWSYEEVRGNKN